jgi:hypothetical protein
MYWLRLLRLAAECSLAGIPRPAMGCCTRQHRSHDPTIVPYRIATDLREEHERCQTAPRPGRSLRDQTSTSGVARGIESNNGRSHFKSHFA